MTGTSFDARRGGRAGLVAMVLGLLLVGMGALTGVGVPAAGAATPEAIRQYDAYPLGLGLVPPGCEAQGPEVLVGARFSVNGGPEVASLRASSMKIGDTLVMRWEGFAPGCEGIGIGLSIKAANDVRFDPSTNQYASHQAYCGPAGDPCTAPYSLTLPLTPSAATPCFQVDAHVGSMLSVVGPDGAYYSFGSSYNMLIDAYNGGTAPCEHPPCPDHPEVPMASVECQILTAQVAPPVTEAPPATEPPATTAPPATAVETAQAQAQVTSTVPAGDASGQAAARRPQVLGAQATLPATGSTLPVGNVVLAGLALLLLGGAAVVGTVGRRSALRAQ